MVKFYYPKATAQYVDAGYLWQVEHEHDGRPVDDPGFWNSGACSQMAMALHRKTGLPIYGLIDDDECLIHAYVKTPNGMLLDAAGERSMEAMFGELLNSEDEYEQCGETEIKLTPDQLADIHSYSCDAWNVYEAEQYIDRHPELFKCYLRGSRKRR